MKRGPRIDADVIGTKPPIDLGPLWNQAPTESVPVASAPVRASGSVAPASSPDGNATCSPGHIGSGRQQPVRRAHVPGYPTKRTGANAERLAFIARAKAAVAPLLWERAKQRGYQGVTSIDTEEFAVREGFAKVGDANQRANSWFSAVPGEAGLIAQGLADVYTRSGNRPTRYVHPEFVRVGGQGVA